MDGLIPRGQALPEADAQRLHGGVEGEDGAGDRFEGASDTVAAFDCEQTIGVP